MTRLPVSRNTALLDKWRRMLDSNVIRSPFKPFEIPKMTLVSRILGALKHHEALHPGKAAVIDGFNQGHRLTYMQIHDQALSLAAFLRTRSFGIGDRATTVLPNCVEFPVIHLAIWAAGGVFVGASPGLKHHDLVYQLRDSGSSVVFTSEELLEAVLGAAKDCPDVKVVICLRSSSAPISKNVVNYHDALQAAPLDGVVAVSADAPCAILYSSGTTGLPKGIVHSSNSFHYIVESMRSHFIDEIYPVLGVSKVDWYQDHQLLAGPCYHLMAFCQLNWFLITGSPIIVLGTLDVSVYIGLIAQFKPRYLFVSPPLIVFFAKDPQGRAAKLDSVQMLFGGGSPLRREVCDEFLVHHPGVRYVVQAYGMTETGAVVMPLLEKEGTDCSCGAVCAGFELKIVTPVTNRPYKRGDIGEICVREPGLALGYYNKPEATRALYDEEQFLHTGDVGYVDERGCLYMVDRLKEIIKVHHHHQVFSVIPSQLEGILIASHSVRDAAVVGVPLKTGGELVRAFVVKADDSLMAADVELMIADKLADFKRITGGVVFVDAIPRSPAGKILRRELKAPTLESRL